MKKKVCLVMLCVLVLGIALLTGCSCKHEWKDATCDAPKTCAKCGETEGEALTHKWVDADCENAKTCSLCKKTEGNALGHTWSDATCETAKTCSVCQKTDGNALGHTWVDATCETAKTCSVCQKTEGSALTHNWVNATCDAPKTCSLCKKTEGSALTHNWVDATCEAPKTCSLCQKTEGTALGHTWSDADCETAKTCSVCQKTEGEALGHKWIAADCETAKTCSVCGKTEGSALGHNWIPATATTAKTCAACGITEGYPVDPRFDAEACKALIGSWSGILQRLEGNATGIEGFTGVVELGCTLYFGDDGSYKEVLSIANRDEFLQTLENDYVAAFYAEFAKQGLNQTQADAAMKATYGVDVRGYSKQLVAATDWDTVYGLSTVVGVYYVENNMIYSGANWAVSLGSVGYTITGNTLTIDSLTALFPDLKFTKIS